MSIKYPKQMKYKFASPKDTRELIVEFTGATTGKVILSASGNPNRKPDWEEGHTISTWVPIGDTYRWEPYSVQLKTYKIK